MKSLVIRLISIFKFSFPLLVLASMLLSACQSQASANEQFIPPVIPTDAQLSTETPQKVFETDLLQATATQSPPVIKLTPTITATPDHLSYYVQSGDTLDVIAQRFGIDSEQITSPGSLPRDKLLPPGQLLLIPLPAEVVSDSGINYFAERLLPDSEVIYSHSATDFDVAEYLEQSEGYLSHYQEYLRSTGWTSAADIINRVAIENSINPRLLLSLLEYEADCVLGQPDESISSDYLMDMRDYRRKGLYLQLGWAASQLSAGYYGWRSGALTEIQLADGIILRPAPDLNAGSVALLNFFAKSVTANENQNLSWEEALDSEQGLPALYSRMFGDPWKRAQAIEPILPAGLTQPELTLPFEPGRLWSYISGPHTVWETEGAQAALDFAPATAYSGCVQTNAWVVAVADGPVVRSQFGTVVQDLASRGTRKSDKREQTGWAILYLHIDDHDRVAPGTYLRAGDRIGHPSCEGGPSNGTHVHIARKYNAEWIPADGPLPFVLSGWVAHAGPDPYEGTLTKDDQTVIAHPYGSYETHITIQKDEP